MAMFQSDPYGILALMFVLSEGAERLVSSDLGNVGSLIVAALVVFALTPLQRWKSICRRRVPKGFGVRGDRFSKMHVICVP